MLKYEVLQNTLDQSFRKIMGSIFEIIFGTQSFWKILKTNKNLYIFISFGKLIV